MNAKTFMPVMTGALVMQSGATVLDALTAFDRNPGRQTIFVVDKNMQYRGSLTRHALFEFLVPYLDFLQGDNPAVFRESLRETSLQELLDAEPGHAMPADNMTGRIVRFVSEGAEEIPVLDTNRRITGQISAADMVREVLSAFRGR